MLDVGYFFTCASLLLRLVLRQNFDLQESFGSTGP